MKAQKIDKREDFWFKIWFAFCALLGLTVTAVGIWAVIRLVTHFTG